MINKNGKARAGGKGFNQNLVAGGKLKGFDVFDYAQKQDNLQSVILSCINQRPRKVIKLFPCGTCGKHYAPARMSIHLNICKNCVRSARAKPDREKRLFVNSALANFHRFLKGAVAL